MTENETPIAQEAYDKLAKNYAENIEEAPYNIDLDFPAVTSLLSDVDGKRILEAGCGSGLYTEWLVDQGADVMAVDVSSEMVKYANERVGKQAEIRQADLEEPLDFADDDEFDIVLSTLALNYVEDWQSLFIEFGRVLKNGGEFVGSIQHPIDDYIRLDVENYFEVDEVTDTWSNHGEPVDVSFYWRPLTEIFNPILDAGFQLETISEPQPAESFKEKMPERYEKLMKQPTFLCIRALYQ